MHSITTTCVHDASHASATDALAEVFALEENPAPTKSASADPEDQKKTPIPLYRPIE